MRLTIRPCRPPAHIHALFVDKNAAWAREQWNPLVCEEGALSLQPSGVARQMPGLPNDPMAGNDDGERVMAQCLRHRTHRLRLPQGSSEPLIAHDGPIGDGGGLLLNQWGLIVGGACATANAADNTFQWLIQQVDGRMIVLSDTGFHAAEGDPSNLKLCQRGEWEDRMLVETVLSMLTLVCHLKKVMHRGWAYFQARLAFTMAAFNVLVQWHGLQPTASGFVPLSIAEFSL
jgi:hypothetical protein